MSEQESGGRPKSSRQIIEEMDARRKGVGRPTARPAAEPETKSAALRRRMDDRNADRYYRGGEQSTVSDSPADGGDRGTGRHEAARRSKLDERNTDRYYRDSTVRPPTKQQLEAVKIRQADQPAPRRPQAQTHRQNSGQLSPAVHGHVRHPLVVSNRQDAKDAAFAAADLLNKGVRSVVIRVTGPRPLGMQVRTFLDAMVGREEITEDQYRDVTIDVSAATAAAKNPAEALGPPAPSGDAAPEEALDVAAFLRGDQGAEYDGEIPEAAQIEAEVPAEVVVDDGDDIDFLRPPGPADDVAAGTLFESADKTSPASPPAPLPPQQPANNPHGHKKGKNKNR